MRELSYNSAPPASQPSGRFRPAEGLKHEVHVSVGTFLCVWTGICRSIVSEVVHQRVVVQFGSTCLSIEWAISTGGRYQARGTCVRGHISTFPCVWTGIVGRSCPRWCIRELSYNSAPPASQPSGRFRPAEGIKHEVHVSVGTFPCVWTGICRSIVSEVVRQRVVVQFVSTCLSTEWATSQSGRSQARGTCVRGHIFVRMDGNLSVDRVRGGASESCRTIRLHLPLNRVGDFAKRKVSSTRYMCPWAHFCAYGREFVGRSCQRWCIRELSYNSAPPASQSSGRFRPAEGLKHEVHVSVGTFLCVWTGICRSIVSEVVHQRVVVQFGSTCLSIEWAISTGGRYQARGTCVRGHISTFPCVWTGICRSIGPEVVHQRVVVQFGSTCLSIEWAISTGGRSRARGTCVRGNIFVRMDGNLSVDRVRGGASESCRTIRLHLPLNRVGDFDRRKVSSTRYMCPWAHFHISMRVDGNCRSIVSEVVHQRVVVQFGSTCLSTEWAISTGGRSQARGTCVRGHIFVRMDGNLTFDRVRGGASESCRTIRLHLQLSRVGDIARRKVSSTRYMCPWDHFHACGREFVGRSGPRWCIRELSYNSAPPASQPSGRYRTAEGMKHEVHVSVGTFPCVWTGIRRSIVSEVVHQRVVVQFGSTCLSTEWAISHGGRYEARGTCVRGNISMRMDGNSSVDRVRSGASESCRTIRLHLQLSRVGDIARRKVSSTRYMCPWDHFHACGREFVGRSGPRWCIRELSYNSAPPASQPSGRYRTAEGMKHEVHVSVGTFPCVWTGIRRSIVSEVVHQRVVVQFVSTCNLAEWAISRGRRFRAHGDG